MKFQLPKEVAQLAKARDRLRARYDGTGLNFTFDGNLVGDLGEAVAAELFRLSLKERNLEGIDAIAEDGRTTVQIKATVTGRGPAFRFIKKRARHLLFLSMDLEKRTIEVVFNGPEKIALSKLPNKWVGQRTLTDKQIRDADQMVDASKRLAPKVDPI